MTFSMEGIEIIWTCIVGSTESSCLTNFFYKVGNWAQKDTHTFSFSIFLEQFF
jgi:hypothetical protein